MDNISTIARTELIESTGTRYKNTQNPVEAGRDFEKFVESIRNGLTNQQLEKKLGMANAWMHGLLKKNKEGSGYIPSVSSLIKISENTGTDINFLLGLTGWEVDAENVKKPLNEMNGVSLIGELESLYRLENESIEAFSRKIGITPPTYRGLKNGKTALNKVTKKKIFVAVNKLKRQNNATKAVSNKKAAPVKTKHVSSVAESDISALMEMNRADFCEFILSYKKPTENIKDYVRSLGISDWTFYQYRNNKINLPDEKKKAISEAVLLKDVQVKEKAPVNKEADKIPMPSETSVEIVEALKEEIKEKAPVLKTETPKEVQIQTLLEKENKKFFPVDDVCKVFSIDKNYAEFIIASHYDEYKTTGYINEDNTQLSADGLVELICKCGVSKNDNGNIKAISNMLRSFFGDNGAAKKELARVTGELNKALTRIKVLDTAQNDFDKKYKDLEAELDNVKKAYDTDLVKYKKILSIINGTDTENAPKASLKATISHNDKPIVIYREINSRKSKAKRHNSYKTELPLSAEEKSWYEKAVNSVRIKVRELNRNGHSVSTYSLLATVYKRMTDCYSVVWEDENHKALDEYNYDEYASFSPLRLCAIDHSETAGNKRSIFLAVLADIDKVYACAKM